ncbi:alpha/beta hydrolase [Gordonia sp. PKS22-38]|uniref:Alpha/beta hydrolase n=1 Tax=Gordonia prachuapensis TaxID=3115651 RepID=A0ABU7MX95_9ACTN|nr:alpha/beta hydrolase [Gordonia sp. PKS22-38]
MTPAFRFADVRGVRLAWNQTGRGSPVIWAHGLSASSYNQEFSGQFDWRAVSSTHRLIRYDARGHGRSSGGRNAGEYTWPELGRDLLGLLDVVAPDEPVAAIGSSMGAATLIYAALSRPERFTRLVLATPPTIWETRRALVAVRLASAGLVEREGLAAFARLAEDAPASPALADARRFVSPIAVRSAIYPAVLRGSAESDLPGLETLAALDLPTLVLSWTGDDSHPVSSGTLLADALPDARLEVADSPGRLHSWPRRVAEFLEDL